MPGRPRRSCDSCNSQKLRCCGQKPTCTRCKRLSRPCVYRKTGTAPGPISAAAGVTTGSTASAAPINGARDAAGAITSTSGRPNGNTHPDPILAGPQLPGAHILDGSTTAEPMAGTGLVSGTSGAFGTFSATLPYTSVVEMSLGRFDLPEKRYFGVPEALIPPLVDLYYTHLYNSSLLMHRPTLERAIATNTIRTDVLLTICALAAKYYTDAKGTHVLVDNHFCRDWAETAGRIAMREAEFPKLDNIVASLNLALFWYSVGDFQRSHMHSACASNTAWVLGMPRSKDDAMGSEVRRRRFWACYLTCCFMCESLFPKAPTDVMLNLNLPCSEAEFCLPNPRPGILLRSKACSNSIYAELVRAMALWSSVVTHIKQSSSSSFSPSASQPLGDWTAAADTATEERLAAIQMLDGRIHKAWLALDPVFRLDVNNIATVPRDDLSRLLLLQIIYRQCFCSLHSSIVPLFSLGGGAYAGFSYAQQLSAQTAFEHANAVSALLEKALTLGWDDDPGSGSATGNGASREHMGPWDPARMPSFIGYAAYCACAIQMPFLWCLQPEVRRRAASNILANLRTLQVLGKYWAFLKLLGRFAFGLYRVHANGPHLLTDEPRKISPALVLNRAPPLNSGAKSSTGGANVPNSRARLSILTHNTIIVSDQSSTLQDVDDIIYDVGLDDAAAAGDQGNGGVGIGGGPNNPNPSGEGLMRSTEETITALIAQILNEDSGVTNARELQMITDAFMPNSTDTTSMNNFVDRDGTVDWVMSGPYLDQFGLIEDRIADLLVQGNCQ